MRASVSVLILLFLPLVQLEASSSFITKSQVDCYITSWNPDTNYGGSDILKASREVVNNETLEARAILGLDLDEIRSRIPMYSKVISAKLELTTYNTSDPAIEVWDVRGEPDVLSVTWNSMKEGRPWSTPGGDLIRKWGEGLGSSPEAVVDITSYVQAVVDGELESKGWLLLKVASGYEGYYEFYSELTAKGPRLEIEYEPASLGIVPETPEVFVTQGRNVSLKVFVTGHLSKQVNLSLDGPDFLSYEFSEEGGIPPFNSTLTISLPETAPGGEYRVIIRAEGVMNASAPLNLTVLERKGFYITGPSNASLVGGLERNLSLRIVPTGNFTGEVSAGVLNSPDWLNVTLSPRSGSPPLNFTVTLVSQPTVEADGILTLIFSGARSRVYRINVSTRVRKIAFYSNRIDWNLSSSAIISASNSTGITVDRINSTELFKEYDLVVVLGGHKAPTDDHMPKNIASSILSEGEKSELIKGGEVVHVERQGSRIIVVVAGADRYKTAKLLLSHKDRDDIPLVEELMLGDPRGI